ncbi:MAG: PD40 domain-containing protein [Bacteroidales bacterium]|nr:PD40 domain-containing protein [Bacteroidales bacterium]
MLKFLNKKITLVIIVSSIAAVFIVYLYFISLANNDIKFRYPLNEAVFPSEFAPPSFKWIDSEGDTSMMYCITFKLKNSKKISYSTEGFVWKPEIEAWDSIKSLSYNLPVQVTVFRDKDQGRNILKQKAKISIRISKYSVDAPVLYRQIPLPFTFAEKNIELTSYSLYNVGSENPVRDGLSNFRVCGNCHSASLDGKSLAVDFDASTRDKGGFFIADIDTQMYFNKDNYISWTKLQGQSTFGLFSKISSDGRYVVTTLKDRVVSEKFDDYKDREYSQLFFPINGILAIYDRQTGILWELEGANDINYVQTNAMWYPDDKYLVFARAKAVPFDGTGEWDSSTLADEELIKEFLTGKRELKYDLYIIPFNDGRGGKAKPLEGASNNGMSNYFPAVSPDGKWLVYCQSEKFMMLQADSRLHIIPAKGGKSQKLKCNFKNMNSWHAWSPNSKWLVYSSKSMSIYTDMFLTHINEKGESSIPVLLENSKTGLRAVNYPEFINRDPGLDMIMNYDYVNLLHIRDAILTKDKDKAKKLLDVYLAQGQVFLPQEFQEISYIYTNFGDFKNAEKYRKLVTEADSVLQNRVNQ